MADLRTRVVPYTYERGELRLLDQRLLPHEEAWISCRDAASTAAAIRSLAVRGAPLIGVAAALGLCAEAWRLVALTVGGSDAAPHTPGEGVAEMTVGGSDAAPHTPGEGVAEMTVGGSGSLRDVSFDARLEEAATLLAGARPTAVNLAAAVERSRGVLAATRGESPAERAAALERDALALAQEDALACLAMAAHGAEWLRARFTRAEVTLLTHCNAGALATAGIGTALGVVRAVSAERAVRVLSDETRPFWQGARLTAWELQKDGLDVTLLPDVAAASTIASGRVDAVIVGADRIARNGDVANKVGTYGLALACRAHGVPFVVAAPRTTVDLACADGKSIPIEWRDGDEVLLLTGASGVTIRVAPEGVPALYPAFDVTPAHLVDAIVTEVGVSTPPHLEHLAELCKR